MSYLEFTVLLYLIISYTFTSEHLHQTVEKMGYVVLEDLSGTEITKRYFHQRADQIRHTQATHLIHLQIV